ncbi:MAG: hypothetical protein KAT74_11945, partial [Candidatus Cloacimonetes bacterium]|nr:hypothetical protein [Candidatus Cloacimonadota bacterium]
MKKLLIFLISFIPTLLFCYEWQQIGTANCNINNYVCSIGGGETLCTDTGIIMSMGGTWIEHNLGLPVWGSIDGYPEDKILIMGDGTDSDGIYMYNFCSGELEVLEYFFKPHFIIILNGDIYVGGEDGLIKSNEGWEPVEFFNGFNCLAMEYYEGETDYYVVTTSDDIFISEDNGETWIQSSAGSPLISDMIFDNFGILWGIFPDHSNSSGLWKSSDFGYSWDIEYFSDAMSSVHITDEKVYVGWEEYFEGAEGVALWNQEEQQMQFMNDGLPNRNINKLSENTNIYCSNLVCCTEEGAFITTSLEVDVIDDQIIKNEYWLSNYPNPFNP